MNVYIPQLTVPKRFKHAVLGDMPADHEVNEYVSLIEAHVHNGSGLALCGSNGVGKTHALAALTNYVSATAQTLYPPVFVRAPELMAAYGRGLHSRDERLEMLNFDAHMEQCWWLVIDDFGKEQQVRNTAGLMSRLLRARYANNACTFITTNMQPMEVADVYGTSVWSIMAETMTVLKVTGPDRRQYATTA